MEDTASIKSNESVATSDEYEFVSSANGTKMPSNNKHEQPLLKIVGNGDLDHLQKCLGEVLIEDEGSKGGSSVSDTKTLGTAENPTNVPCINETGNEEEQLEPIADVYQECTLFGCISYLGSAAINAPKSKVEILRNMAILNEEQTSDQAIKISVSVPNSSDGVVVLYDACNNSVMARFDVQRIMFYACGLPDTNEHACFAFTYLHGDSQETAIFQCHVFRCDIPEAVGQVTLCFGKAFQRPSNSMTNSTQSVEGDVTYIAANGNAKTNTQTFIFEVGLEIKEDDGKGNFVCVPRDRNALKLRANVRKQICLKVQQVFSKEQQELEIERCFGVLVSPGINVKHSDMQLLDMVSMGTTTEDENGQKVYLITGHWDPKEPIFEPVNVELSKLYITVAVDLVIRRIREPVRLSVEIQTKMFPHNERFWYFSKPPIFHQFYLGLKEVPCKNGSVETVYEVTHIERSSELEKGRLNYAWTNIASLIRSTSNTSLEDISPKDDFSDNDEPIVSGTGEVSKDCPDNELERWNEFLVKWANDPGSKPKYLFHLVRQGIPEALRGEVWQRLVNCDQDDKLVNTYRLLISKECSCERIIQKDISRTFPAHDYFKDAGGVGQDTLYNIAKAYAVYDTEIGYCQGITFIAASLLLHMPEEQAFCVLVKLMYEYGLRDLYKDGFENLYMRLYQLNRLLEEKEPQLWQHFKNLGVETHMFASHWFLTVYTARFPLYFVFYILDVTLVQGLDTMFQIALALLKVCKKELLTLDFESILKFFQVTLPKKCRNQRAARSIIERACNIKLKKLKKYEREFISLKAAQETPEPSPNELEVIKSALQQSEEEKKRLRQQVNQLHEKLSQEMRKYEQEKVENSVIISEYKRICRRLNSEQDSMKTFLSVLQEKIGQCGSCRPLMDNTFVMSNGVSKSENNIINGADAKWKNNTPENITTLEMELAHTKLALVEAECSNQDLTHKLNAVCAELQAARNSYPPWLLKTLSSIKEVAAVKKISSPIAQSKLAKLDTVNNHINSSNNIDSNGV